MAISAALGIYDGLTTSQPKRAGASTPADLTPAPAPAAGDSSAVSVNSKATSANVADKKDALKKSLSWNESAQQGLDSGSKWVGGKFNDGFQWLGNKASSGLQAVGVSKDTAQGVKGVFGGLGEFNKGTVEGLGHVVSHPVQTVQSLGHMVMNPSETANVIGDDVKRVYNKEGMSGAVTYGAASVLMLATGVAGVGRAVAGTAGKAGFLGETAAELGRMAPVTMPALAGRTVMGAEASK